MARLLRAFMMDPSRARALHWVSPCCPCSAGRRLQPVDACSEAGLSLPLHMVWKSVALIQDDWPLS